MLSEDTIRRAAHGLAPRKANATLQETAQELANMLAAGAPFSHGVGGGMSARLDRNGWRGQSAAENIAYGSDTAVATFGQWMGSAGHRANILGPYELCGFGHAVGRDGTHYWAADYGSLGVSGGGSGVAKLPWWVRILGRLWR